MEVASERARRRILYWCLQVFGWGSYFGCGELIVVVVTHNRALALAWPFIGVEHLAASHVLRSVFQKHQWIKLPVGTLLFRMLGLCALLAVAVQLAAIPLVVGFGAVSFRQQLRDCWQYGLYSFVLFLVWSALYLAFEYFFLYRDTELDRLRLESNLREMELAALKAQVNPHFLFNCLNNVRSLVVEDRERAREMLLRLSDLLRYALNAGRFERVPLSEELRVVSDYLDLEKLQYEERLSWDIDLSEEALGASIPPMLLQQLVENAVKHGIAGQPGRGVILISARIDDNGLRLRVENTGQLSMISGNGFGLTNARERLRLLCGSGAALSLENMDRDRVAATVAIPSESL
jgi:signal transduction histidine kinase